MAKAIRSCSANLSRCAGLGGGHAESVLRVGGGNGREAESGLGRGARSGRGAQLQIAVDSPGGCQAPHPGHRRVPIERATWLRQRRRQRQRRGCRLQKLSRRRYAPESARWSPSSDISERGWCVAMSAADCTVPGGRRKDCAAPPPPLPAVPQLPRRPQRPRPDPGSRGAPSDILDAERRSRARLGLNERRRGARGARRTRRPRRLPSC